MFAGGVRFSALRFWRASATIQSQMPNSVLIVDDHPSFRASARVELVSAELARLAPRLEHERSTEPVPQSAAA
jgi:hypothetical protein